MEWPCAKANFSWKRKMCLLRHTATVDLMDIYFTYFHYAFVMPCVPRTFSIPSFLSHSKLTSQLVLARHWAGQIYFAGGKRWPAHAHCSCAPCSAQAPPAPPYACAGALGLTVQCFVVKFIRTWTWAECIVLRKFFSAPLWKQIASFSSGMKGMVIWSQSPVALHHFFQGQMPRKSHPQPKHLPLKKTTDLPPDHDDLRQGQRWPKPDRALPQLR